MSAHTIGDPINNNRDLVRILRTTGHVIALFYASWCPFCVRFLPIFKRHTGMEGQHFIMVQDDQETIADTYSVKIYPTVLFFKKGVISKRLDGVGGVGLDEEQLIEFVNLCPPS